MRILTSAWLRRLSIFIPIGILMVLYGCVIGWASVAIFKLQQPGSPIALPKSQITFVAAAFELGRFFLAIPAGMLGDKIGRKPVILFCGIQHFIVWCVINFTSNKDVIFFLRFLSGTAVGTGNAVLFIYAGEVAPPKIRGTLLSVLYTCYYLGIFIEYIFGAYLSFQMVSLSNLSIALLFFVFVFNVKESPNYLLCARRTSEAKETHAWLHPDLSDEEKNREFNKLKEYVENNRGNGEKSMKNELMDPVNMKCIGLVFLINFFTQLTGLPAVVVFVHSLFTSTTVLSVHEFAIIFAGFQYLAACSSSLLSDKIGRRQMYNMTCGMCAICHIFSGTMYYLERNTSVDIPHFSWLMLVSVSSYACIYAAGLGPLTVIVRGELLPQSVKGIGSGLAVVSAGFSCFLLIFIFHNIDRYLGLAYNFFFFALMAVILQLLVYFMLPETKHKSLAEIQASFKKSCTKG